VKIIDVDKVEIAKKPIKNEILTKDAVTYLLGKKFESCSDRASKIIPVSYHALAEASYVAYEGHRPLVLSPDMVWLTIAQGIATHVNENSEKLRKQFVKHDGKEKIEVRRDEFIKGSPDNEWENALEEFSEKIKEKMVPTAHKDITASFSTTGLVERTAYNICLMDTVKSYFDYGLKTMCGIPQVIIEGTDDDWIMIRDKVHSLKNAYGLSWWFSGVLIPVIDEMVESIINEDGSFWQEWYKPNGGSGGPYIQGHITKLFPYLHGHDWDKDIDINIKNTFRDEHSMSGITTDQFPNGISSAPFIWEYYEEKFPMNFMAGFIGFTQDKNTMAVRPKIGWAVMEEVTEKATKGHKDEYKMMEDIRKMREKLLPYQEEPDEQPDPESIIITPSDAPRKLKLGWTVEEKIGKVVINHKGIKTMKMFDKNAFIDTEKDDK